MTVWKGPDGYWVSDDNDLIDVALVQEWLSTLSYWAQSRPRHTTEKAIARSLNLSLYGSDGAQAGFCRWVTDGAYSPGSATCSSVPTIEATAWECS